MWGGMLACENWCSRANCVCIYDWALGPNFSVHRITQKVHLKIDWKK